MDIKDQIIQGVIDKTNSEIILFFILVLIALVIVCIPIYNMVLKDRKARLAHENEREKQIIAVITANTEAITGLKTTLEISRTSTSDSFSRIHTRIDGHGTVLAQIQSTLNEILRLLMKENAR